MEDFTTNNDGGLITDTLSTRETYAAPEETAEAAATPEGEGTSQPAAEPDALEARRREMEADYTRKTQALADLRRQTEAEEQAIRAREQALEARARALAPLEQFDSMVASDENLRNAVAPLIQNYQPGQAQTYADRLVQQNETTQQQMQKLTVSTAQMAMMQKYPDYAQHQNAVADVMWAMNAQYPGHDITKVTAQLETAYKLATQGRTVAAAKVEAEKETVKKVAATKLSPGTSGSAPATPSGPPTRRADGRLTDYDSINEWAKTQMRR